MSKRTMRNAAIGVATVAVILTALLSGSARAQEAPTALPTGKLVVAPQTVERGQTTLAVGFHVEPDDLEVKIEYSGHFIPEGESCDDAGTSGTTTSAVAPTWVTLQACTVGDAIVKLVAADTGVVIETVNVTVVEPTVGGQAASPAVELSGVVSGLDVGQSNRFTVSVSGLDSDEDYELYTVPINYSLAFNRGCTDREQTEDISNRTSYSVRYRVYACMSPGSALWAYLRHNGSTVANTSINNNYINVTPTVSFSPSSYRVDEGSNVSVRVRLKGANTESPTIPIRVRRGSAEGDDYTVPGLSNGMLSLSFSRGDRSQSFEIRTHGDSDCDNETINVRFGRLPSEVAGGEDSSATVRIIDTDDCGTISPPPPPTATPTPTPTPPARPATPADLKGVTMIGGRGITLSWQAVADATDYQVESSFGGQTRTYTRTTTSLGLVGMTPEAIYSFRVRSRKSHGGGYLTSDWSSAVSYPAPEPSHWQGHQEDHTVAYEVDSMPTPSPILPDGADPGVVIPASIGAAVEAWNTLVAEKIPGKNLKICTVMEDDDECDVSNHDERTITIKTVNNNNDSMAVSDPNHNQGCGRAVACVKADIPTLSVSAGPGFHLGDISLIIEEPAWECVVTDEQTNACENIRIYWTDIADIDGNAIIHYPAGELVGLFYYINATMIHEFGHTFGLPDFGDVPSLDGLLAIMDDAHNITIMEEDIITIMEEDIKQLRAIYRIHNSTNH